jgi:hypothetical protein
MRRLFLTGILLLGCSHATTGGVGAGGETSGGDRRSPGATVAVLPTGTLTTLRRAPEPLTRDQIVANMQKAAGRVRDCRDEQTGSRTAVVRVKVAPSGQVASVRTMGLLGGTPAGACVAQAVRKTAFPPSGGRSFDYVFASN